MKIGDFFIAGPVCKGRTLSTKLIDYEIYTPIQNSIPQGHHALELSWLSTHLLSRACG